MLCCFNMAFAQFNVIKYIPSYNADVTRKKLVEVDLNSYGVSYERCITDHASLEILGLRARMVTQTPQQGTKVLTGFGAELRYRYYFQTNPSFLSYAPFEFYVAPTVNYTQMQTPYLNDFHELKYISVGGIVGFQLIFELFQEGFAVDGNLGFNINNYESTGFMSETNMYRFTPRVGLALGYTF